MGANLITGNLYSPITAAEDSDFQAGVIGNKTQILNVGNKMTLSIIDNSTVQCTDGVLVTKEGRRVQIDNGATVDWVIPTGAQEITKHFVVGFRLYVSGDSAELCETFVEEVASATDVITENTFRNGATEVYVSLGRVVQDGITLKSVQRLIPLADDLVQLRETVRNTTSNMIQPLKNDGFEYPLPSISCGWSGGSGIYRVIGQTSSPIAFFPSKYGEADVKWVNVVAGTTYKLLGAPDFEGAKVTIGDAELGVRYYEAGYDGIIFTAEETERTYINIYIPEGTDLNLTYKPMLTTDLSARYEDFVTYTGDSGRLNEDVSRINSDLAVNVLGERIKPIFSSGLTFNFTNGVATIDVSRYLESGYHFAKACFAIHTTASYFIVNSASINTETNTLTVRASTFANEGVTAKFNGTASLGVLFFLTRN